MYIVHVSVHVLPECVEPFKAATIKNADKSLKEPGVARFDFIQQEDDPTRFMLVEVYRSPQDAAKHKETSHYETWRDKVATMMAEPRRSVKYVNIVPDDPDW